MPIKPGLLRCLLTACLLVQGLKANLNRLLGGLSEENILECKATSRYPKLLYALAFYHSVLLERRKFRTLGFNNFYDFNDTDFKVGSLLRSL